MQTSAKHTPGPWTVNPLQLDQVATDTDPPRLLARVFYEPGAELTAVADARLIAAAPDLLAALIALSDALPSDQHMREVEGREPGPGLLMMRAAIVKATGEAGTCATCRGTGRVRQPYQRLSSTCPDCTSRPSSAVNATTAASV